MNSRLSSLAFVALVSFAACGVPTALDGVGAPSVAEPGLGGPHLMPFNDGTAEKKHLRGASAPAGAHLTYYGGRVISNVQVVQVLWGAGSYLSNVSNVTSPSMATFYTGVSTSAYFDWLTEYNSAGGTNQTIGHGTFAGQYTITPASNSTTVADTTIETELGNQIAAGHLPPPTKDGLGNNNTYYAVFFPHGDTITQGTSSSCVGGGFCAFHGTVSNANGFGEIYYGVHPDMQAGSGCDQGCGNAGTTFGNMTSVASHELVEAVTDAEVGIAANLAPPLAWYDNTNGEIGDICNAQQGSILGCDGVTYTVQTEFSNQANNCIISKGANACPVANDFTIAVGPATATVTSGGNAVTQTYSVTTTTSKGAAQTVSLAISGLAAGVTGSFAPASVTSGGTSTLTLTVAANSKSSSATFTVTGTATSGTHAASATLVVKGSDFSISAAPASATVTAGANPVNQGYTITTAVTQGAAQTVTLSVSGLAGGVTGAFNPASVTSGGTSTLTLTVAANAASSTSNFTVTGTGTIATHTATATLIVNGTGPRQLAVNGGFETGDFTGWSTTGITSVVATAHSGTKGARVGSTGAFNGDSTITQNIAVPGTGTTTLSFWWQGSCTDTVQYDWQLVQVIKSGTVVATPLAKQCSTKGWTQVTSDLTPYKGSTVSLRFLDHDDGYANPADPTYMIVDDVSVTNQ